MNKVIMFKPVCPVCNHIFNHIEASETWFYETCPECGQSFTSIAYPNFDDLYEYNKDGIVTLIYDEEDVYRDNIKE